MRRQERYRRSGIGGFGSCVSLVLDEIASTSLALQERLLRVVEYGAFERVGGSATVQVDVRVIGATNVDLPSEAAAGRFRPDLLDRLAFDVLTAPPLRARREDIPLLAEHFGRAMAHDLGWPSFAGFGADALDALLAHPWPGNVRELKNVVERAVYRAVAPGRRITGVQFDPFASPFRPAPAHREPGGADQDLRLPQRDDWATSLNAEGAMDLRQSVGRYERQLLTDALARHRHNQRATAGALGLTYDQLRNQLRKHGLLPADTDRRMRLEAERRAPARAGSSGRHGFVTP